jgi:hypothetical protein
MLEASRISGVSQSLCIHRQQHNCLNQFGEEQAIPSNLDMHMYVREYSIRISAVAFRVFKTGVSR